MKNLLAWVVVIVAPFVSGCSTGLNPVKGKVTYQDGSPVTAGSVVVETVDTGNEQRSSANGNILPDGTFQLTSLNPGDGVPEGRYRVAVLSPPLSDDQVGRGEKPLVDIKYSQLDTSGLEIEVKPGLNEVTLTVDKPGGVASSQ
jgi:hypothetical protein